MKIDPRYPIGKFEKPDLITSQLLADWIDSLSVFPAALTQEVINLSASQLNTPYREKGWTVRQVVHHCADSHMNAYIRFKLALTEQNPVIKPYEEALWALLPDSEMDIAPSLSLLTGLHARWSSLLKGMSASDFSKTYQHPEMGVAVRLDEATGMYAWHCKHHLAHILMLKRSAGW
ncbi:hypothetical protein ADIS_0594 [Lunatimonas lonarensis]|uniref:DinB-like domain-containing protein n=1 Tax=Lunatimonas lonarensis TaxID=1232681 RepID=R7ZXX3_9BACT|nr:putative metal-dependent hydrolase [Lunatimonas lonarensis]EON79001.1 hypothetical protein ADIS_0594 [Lunatimonas lonarensis]